MQTACLPTGTQSAKGVEYGYWLVVFSVCWPSNEKTTLFICGSVGGAPGVCAARVDLLLVGLSNRLVELYWTRTGGACSVACSTHTAGVLRAVAQIGSRDIMRNMKFDKKLQ